jgi:hypothetical protein
MKSLKCPTCKKAMEYLGNVSKLVYTPITPQWDAVYICRKDRVKTLIREGEEAVVALPPLGLDEYRRITVE